MRHIRLSREADAIVVAPASADIIAKMAGGHASDLASTALLASDKPALLAPAMNHRMWHNAATQRNIAFLKEQGHQLIGPDDGAMACGEYGIGRMAEPADILEALIASLGALPAPSEPILLTGTKPLAGRKALVTSGPTYEAIDSVRFLGNRSSGRQGHAIASALKAAGADVTLISGPVDIEDPAGITCHHVESALEMHTAALNALPVDIAVCAAAVSDWKAEKPSDKKIKKSGKPPKIALAENPDILKDIATHKNRPHLVIGFAAETDNLDKNAQAKLKTKKCDWILANDVSGIGAGGQKVFGSTENHIHFYTSETKEDWGRQSKADIAAKLVRHIKQYFDHDTAKHNANAAE